MRAKNLSPVVIAMLIVGGGPLGCGNFDDPNIVIDLRMVAMGADVPEQVIPYEPGVPPDPTMIELAPVTVCAVVADPAAARPLAAQFRLCPVTGDLRCNSELPSAVLATFTLDDPDTTSPAPRVCTTIEPNANFLAVVQSAFEQDPLAGFSGIDLEVELTITGDATATAPREQIVGGKRLRIAAQIPVERTANQNPRMERIDALVDGETTELTSGRCADVSAPRQVRAGAQLELLPIEPADVRETYVVPTFDGGSRTFTETMTYQWIATAGSFSSGSTGGPRDGFGNIPPLETTWTAPTAADTALPARVSLWTIQRDERLGVSWQEACVDVVP